jgi:hypothetical protein
MFGIHGQRKQFPSAAGNESGSVSKDGGSNRKFWLPEAVTEDRTSCDPNMNKFVTPNTLCRSFR